MGTQLQRHKFGGFIIKQYQTDTCRNNDNTELQDIACIWEYYVFNFLTLAVVNQWAIVKLQTIVDDLCTIIAVLGKLGFATILVWPPANYIRVFRNNSRSYTVFIMFNSSIFHGNTYDAELHAVWAGGKNGSTDGWPPRPETRSNFIQSTPGRGVLVGLVGGREVGKKTKRVGRSDVARESEWKRGSKCGVGRVGRKGSARAH